MLHYSTWTMEDYFARVARYSELAAQQLHLKGRRMGFWKMLSCWPLHFAKFYLLKQGFRDGMPGLAYNCLSATSVTMRYVSLWAKGRETRREQLDPLPRFERAA